MGRSSVEVIETKLMDYRSLSSSEHQETPYMHKVGVSPKQNLLDEFKTTIKETLFLDDSLRPFKDQPRSRKFVLGLQDIGYSKLANLPPQYGLYSSFVPPLVYAFMGSSRDIAIGPIAVVSLLLGSLLSNEINKTTNPIEYRRLAFTASFIAGITQATLGILRLGFLIDFLSHAAVVGFMGGAAITISLQQLEGFLGIKKFTFVFEELHRSLQKREVQLVLSNPGRVVIDKLHASNFVSQIGEDKIFLTVADAVLPVPQSLLKQ